MKRKLIELDVFERIKNDSLSTAEKEIVESAAYLSRALGLDNLEVSCYGSEDVMFESIDGTYVHANYSIDNGFVTFDNIEQLVINEDSEKTKSKEILSKMLDCVIESKDKEADELFGEWLDLPGTKRIFNEVRKKRVVPKRKGGKIVGYTTAYWNVNPKKHQKASVKLARAKGKKIKNKKTPDSVKKLRSMQRKRAHASLGHMVKEWHVLSENVLNYVNYSEFGPVVKEANILRDENDNIKSVKIPTSKNRNNSKVLQFNWKTMSTDMANKRNKMKNVGKDEKFAKDMAKIKKENALSNEKGLEEAIQNAATSWSDVIYLTQDELSNQIKNSLELVEASNYDDSTCDFISEGLLRTIFETYVDRVSKILKISGSKINESANDAYAEFSNIVNEFYNKVDESLTLEMQMFVDLYEALRGIHQMAQEEDNKELALETANHLDGLLSIINQETEPSLEIASEAANWLYEIVESNLEGLEWETSEPVMSAKGEHPMIYQNAKNSYAPNSNKTGKYQPTSDGKESEEAKEELASGGLANVKDEDVYPNLNNPYLLKNGNYKIFGEKDIESEGDKFAHAGSEDTWPDLKNPMQKHSPENVSKVKE